MAENIKNEAQSASSDNQFTNPPDENVAQKKESTGIFFTEPKKLLSNSLRELAQNLRKTADSLNQTAAPTVVGSLTAQYEKDLGRQIERLSQYIERTNLSDASRDLENFARRQPALFIAGALTLGFVGARFMKTLQLLEKFYSENRRS